MLVYVKLLLHDLSGLSEVLHFLVANMTGLSCLLSCFLLPCACQNSFLGTADWDDNSSPHVHALEAFKWVHYVPLSLDTWKSGK